MCGDAEPHKAVAVLEGAFTPTKTKLTEIRRGMVSHG
jgi:S-adenosylmethionine/arginine decarboxylase-like enzyme